VRPHLATLVDDCRHHGTQNAVVVHRGNRQYITTYAELARLSERVAAELMRRGINIGDRVVLWGQNSGEWVAAFFGCVLRGVLVVPLDATGAIDFAQRVIADTSPRLLIGDRSLLSRLAAPATDIPSIALEDLAASLPMPPFEGALQEASLGLDTPLQILFTSGTTSEPKGIVHTHRNVLASLEPIEREMQKYLRYERIFHPLRFLHTLPLSHVFGQFMGLWIPPLLAAEVHFENRLQAPRLLELIRSNRISVLAAVPRVLSLLKSHLESIFPGLPARLETSRGQRIWHRWWSFRREHRAFGLKFWAFVCGGASLPPPVERFWNDLGFALIQGYGMTETAALITLNHPFHVGQGTISKPLPGRDIRIAADGELLVRGEIVASAGWRNGRMQERHDPWLATGDLVEKDHDGQLHFRGRKSETIVTSAGLNIHPEDVEEALNRQPGVQASVVVPLETPDDTVAVAVLIFRGNPAQAQAAIDAANLNLAEYQRVRLWKLWPQLDFPRTAIGKIQRLKIAQWVAAQSTTLPSPAVAIDPLADLIATLTPTQSAKLEDSAHPNGALNLDSLARVQLQTELEQRLGVAIGDQEFEQIATIGQLRACLGSEPAQSCGLSSSTQDAPGGPRPALPIRQPLLPPHFHYPHWTWWPVVQALRVAFQELVMRPLVWLLAAPTISRQVTLQPPDQPLLLIANHVTAFDAPLVLYSLPWRIRRKVAVAMSGEMLEDWRHARNQGNWLLNLLAPFEYWLITGLFNVFPLPRSAGFRRSFAHAGEAMDRGHHVLVFPEGRRSSDGALQPFRPGIALLARESNASILPVALKGLGELKQGKRFWFRSRLIQIRIGELFAPNAQIGPEEFAKSLQETISALLR
jgi:long-chain acyl-CoA synthetase